MGRANIENLIPNSERTPEQLRAQTRKGGIKSGEARREKKRISQIYAEFLIDEHEIEIDEDMKKMSGEKLLKETIKRVVVRGDSASVSMMREIREATEGNKVELSGLLETASLTPDERKSRIAELEKKRGVR